MLILGRCQVEVVLAEYVDHYKQPSAAPVTWSGVAALEIPGASVDLAPRCNTAAKDRTESVDSSTSTNWLSDAVG
jgi:hypothetical protein